MYPVVNAGRVVQSFNDGWYYAACDDNRLQEVQRHEEGWQQVHLPHTWNADAYSTRNYRRASSWYKKEFRTDAAQMRDKQLYLKFDGVNSLADVYLNGELLTTHKGGYSAFTVDITDKVRTDAPNLLMVHVNNQNDRIPPLSGDFTIFGGIYRNVLDTDGKTVAQSLRSVRIDADGAFAFEERLQLEKPQLWSPDSPSLYSVKVSLKDVRGKVLKDETRVPLGVRWFSVDAQEGFKLNGEPLKLMGACRHQDQMPMGIALSDEMHRRDMQLLKDMGVNFVRLAHYPQDDAVLRARFDSFG